MATDIERLYKDSRSMAVKSHTRYCRDFLPSGPIQDLAIRTGEATSNFFYGLAVYINDELAMFEEHKLDKKEALILMSSQAQKDFICPWKRGEEVAMQMAGRLGKDKKRIKWTQTRRQLMMSRKSYSRRQ